MLPAALTTVSSPSFIRQRAGPRSLVLTHASRFRPSKRMIASEGGAAPRPGSTLGGTGAHCSVVRIVASRALRLSSVITHASPAWHKPAASKNLVIRRSVDWAVTSPKEPAPSSPATASSLLVRISPEGKRHCSRLIIYTHLG